eukprot:Selendium_serpulae@DN6437_c12_g1_i1.p1
MRDMHETHNWARPTASARVRENKQQESIAKTKLEIATLLQSGKDERARIKVMQWLREEATAEVLEILQTICELLSQRMKQIDEEKHCPGELLGLVHSAIYCEARLDLPELTDFKHQIKLKYGKDWVSDAANDGRRLVNPKIVVALGAVMPDSNLIDGRLEVVAQQHNLAWRSPALEQLRQEDSRASQALIKECVTPPSFNINAPPGQIGLLSRPAGVFPSVHRPLTPRQDGMTPPRDLSPFGGYGGGPPQWGERTPVGLSPYSPQPGLHSPSPHTGMMDFVPTPQQTTHQPSGSDLLARLQQLNVPSRSGRP